jgi:hypothetical protein
MNNFPLRVFCLQQLHLGAATLPYQMRVQISAAIKKRLGKSNGRSSALLFAVLGNIAFMDQQVMLPWHINAHSALVFVMLTVLL